MKNYSMKSLEVTMNVSGPETVEEFDQLAGENGKCLTIAVTHIMQHSTASKFRDALCELLAEETGVARKADKVGEKEVTDAEGNVVMEPLMKLETEKNYVARVREEAGIDLAQLQEYADKVNETLVIDPSVQKREAKPKSAQKRYLGMAQSAAEKGKLGALAEALSDNLGRDVEETIEDVALAIQEDMKAKEASFNF